MKPKLYSCLTIVLFAAIFVFSCKKGDTGPAGPAGAAGPAGPAGAQGPKGDSATANVTYSAWLDVPFTFTLNPNDNTDTLYWSGSITAAKVTATVLNQGDVKVYFNFGTAANPDIIALPFFDLTLGLNITTEFIPGTIGIFANANLSPQGTGTDKVGQFRYVIIPGTKPASATPGLNYKDYNSVAKYYNIPN